MTKAKAKQLKEELAALNETNELLDGERALLQHSLEAEKFNHFHTREKLVQAKNAKVCAESDLAAAADGGAAEAAAIVTSKNFFLSHKVDQLTSTIKELRSQIEESHADLQDRDATICALRSELD